MPILENNLSESKRFRLANIQHFEGLLLLIFFVLGLLGILNHAMWRDELNGWLIARDSLSLTDFWNNIRYEGHPILWYACLYVLNQITANAIAMQLFHLGLATVAISLFIYFSPFTRLQKLLFVLGYLPIYEYLLISRNYAIGILCLFAFCSLFQTRKKSYLALALILALLANTNAYCLLITIALLLTLSIEYFSRKFIDIPLKVSQVDALVSLGIVVAGIILSVILLMPPGDSTLQGGADQWFFQWDFHRFNQALTRIWNSYILVLVPGDSKPLDVFLFAVISIGILAFTITAFSDYPIVLCFYLLGTGAIVLFTYLKFLGSARHYGHLYIILITAFWLRSYYSPSQLIPDFIKKYLSYPKIKFQLHRWRNWVKRYQVTFLMILLYAQLAAGIVSYSRDIFLPYSASRETANYIKSMDFSKYSLVGSEDFAISPISGYLQAQIYYPESKKLGSFVLFNQQRQIVTDSEVLAQVHDLILQTQKPVLLILNHKLDASQPNLIIKPIQEFTNSFIGNEVYYLYEVNAVSDRF
ncbi:MAG: hypothetical protein VKJ02_05725 [Snowella sp.]|nr:hypothetical protein [Snowella sp.]